MSKQPQKKPRASKGKKPKAVKTWAVWYPDTGKYFMSWNGLPELYRNKVQSDNADGWRSIPVRIVPIL